MAADFVMENFSDAPASDLEAGLFNALNFASELTLRHVMLGVALIVCLVFLARHKRIMAEVRASILTISGIVSGAIHAVIALGVYRAFW